MKQNIKTGRWAWPGRNHEGMAHEDRVSGASGNPTVEPEMAELTPPGVSLHFTRMHADGPAGTHAGQEERNRSQVESIPACVRLLAMVRPGVIVLAHTATSYTLGRLGF